MILRVKKKQHPKNMTLSLISVSAINSSAPKPLPKKYTRARDPFGNRFLHCHLALQLQGKENQPDLLQDCNRSPQKTMRRGREPVPHHLMMPDFWGASRDWFKGNSCNVPLTGATRSRPARLVQRGKKKFKKHGMEKPPQQVTYFTGWFQAMLFQRGQVFPACGFISFRFKSPRVVSQAPCAPESLGGI